MQILMCPPYSCYENSDVSAIFMLRNPSCVRHIYVTQILMCPPYLWYENSDV